VENDRSQKYCGWRTTTEFGIIQTEQMEQYGKILAGYLFSDRELTLTRKLLSRLAENETILLEVHDLGVGCIKANRPDFTRW